MAVIGGALLIRFTGELWLDPLLGALVGIWVVPRVWALLAASMTGAVNAAFQQVDLNAFRRELAALPGVTEVQALHVWSATRGVHSVTVHLVGAEVNRDLVVKVHEIAAVHGMPYVIMRIEPAGLHAGDGDGLARQ
ncbi:hypothetical protein ACFOUS_22200 [Deinococcus metalli]|uniref:hypothetical protein n=1 Tax=Deinococcus metalli TaxID=1141878 RepID=UPI0036236ED9